MKARLKSALAGVSALAIAGTILVTGAATASATTPGWTPDANVVGGLYFYNSAGHEVTSGLTTDAPMAAYYVAAGGKITGSSPQNAFQAFSTPVQGANSATWASTQAITGSQAQTYAAKSALPGDLKTTTNAIVNGASTDGSLSTNQIAGFPNASAVVGYAGMYEVRVYTGNSLTWYSAIVQVSGSTWTQVFPATTATTLTDSASPSTVINPGSSTLTATVSPAPAGGGTVTWSDGTNTYTGAVNTSTGVATATIPFTTIGVRTYSAAFAPTPGTASLGSTAASAVVTVVAPADVTNTAVTVSPASGAANVPQTLVAVVTNSTNPGTTPVGSVLFYDTASSTPTTPLAGAVTQSPVGTFTVSTTLSAVVTHTIKAVFTATDSTLFATSNGTAASFSLTTPALCTPGAGCDPQSIDAVVQAGTLTITTPYDGVGAGGTFHVGNMNVTSDGKYIQSAAVPFPATGQYLTVTDTRAGNLPWTASVYDTDLVSGGNTINGENVGITNWVTTPVAGNGFNPASPNFTTTNLPSALGAAPGVHSAGSGLGVYGGGSAATASTFAHAVIGVGTVQLNGTLQITAPTSTVAGTYTGTITFTVA